MIIIEVKCWCMLVKHK